MHTNNQRQLSASITWTRAGLGIALLGLPAVVFGYRLLVEPTTSVVHLLARELTVFALMAALLWIIRSKEQLTLASIGLHRGSIGKSLAWGLLAAVLLVGGVASAMGMLQVLGLSYGSGESRFVAPVWMTLIVVLRAGIVEEVFYRGYAIERLQALTGSRAVATFVPLTCFALFHYRQGIAGILIALILGAILTAFYCWKRNLLANIIAHFLIDFVPNIVLPMLSSD